MDNLEPYDIIKVSVEFPEAKEDNNTCKLIKVISYQDSDNELSAIAAELKKPVIVEDDFFNKLYYNRSFNNWETKIEFNGEAANLILEADNNNSFENSKKFAKQILKNHKKWEKNIQDFAVSKLLKLKNDTWLDEEEEKVSAQEFIDKMKVESVIMFHDGEFEFFYNDGDLFWGHSIQIRGNIKKGLDDADIVG